MANEKYKVCPVCGEHNRPSSLECRKCETDLTGVRVVDSETEQLQGGIPDPMIRVETGDEYVRICSECGAENPAQARKCASCGEDISDILPTKKTGGTETSGGEETHVCAYQMISYDGSYMKEIDKPVAVIGRDAELSDYLSDKLYVSRRQAEIVITADMFFIKNLSKTNKTFVNDIELEGEAPVALHDGDEIGLGGKVIDGERQSLAGYFIFRVLS